MGRKLCFNDHVPLYGIEIYMSRPKPLWGNMGRRQDHRKVLSQCHPLAGLKLAAQAVGKNNDSDNQ